MGEKTAYVEVGGHDELGRWNLPAEEGYFQYQGVYYYPKFQKEKIPVLLNQDYEKIIIDFGDEYQMFRDEILRCDVKIFFLNLNPWQYFAAEKLLNELEKAEWGNITPIFASVAAVEKEKKRAEHMFGIRIEQIPIINNPLCVEMIQFSCLEQILRFPAAKKRRKRLRMHTVKNR